MRRSGAHRSARQSSDGMDHALFGIVEPVLDILFERFPAHIRAQLQQFALADSCCTHRRQIIAPPLIGDADAHAAHADDVLDILVVLLHLDGRKYQRAFLVHIARRAVIGGRDRIADIGLMGLGQKGKMMFAGIVDHRHQKGMIGRVGIPVIGRIVQEHVAFI